LHDLAASHSAGRTRIILFQREYFLEAESLNDLPDCNQVAEKAQRILRIICGLAKVRRFSASPIKAASILWTDGDGNWVGRLQIPSVQYRVVPGTRYLEGANISDQILALAETDEVVRTNLIDFLGEWNFSRLRRITDSILIGVGGDKKGGLPRCCAVAGQPCRSVSALTRARISAAENFFGAHSRLEGAPGQNPTSLVMASEFVRKLARWIDSKIVTANNSSS
jgi:hypothetical protein